MLSFKKAIEMRVIKKAEVLDAIESSPARSVWARGVKAYAYDLLYDFDADTNFARLTERDLLNGAADWRQYSWGGCAYCYNKDIANALCTPTELKRTKNGTLRPNSREEWLDVQARALYQASSLILRTIAEMNQPA